MMVTSITTCSEKTCRIVPQLVIKFWGNLMNPSSRPNYEDGGSRILRNVETYLLNYKASRLERQ